MDSSEKSEEAATFVCYGRAEAREMSVDCRRRLVSGKEWEERDCVTTTDWNESETETELAENWK